MEERADLKEAPGRSILFRNISLVATWYLGGKDVNSSLRQNIVLKNSPVQLGPNTFGLSLNTFHRVDKDNSTIDNATSTLHFHAKVCVTRGVYEVKVPVFPLHGYACGLNRNPSFPFYRKEVRGCAASINCARFCKVRRLI